MRQNVLTAGLVACAVAAIWPGPVFGSVSVRATLQPAERTNPAPMVVRPWIWESIPYYLTVPLAPSWIDSRPCGPRGIGTGDLH
jgi:hypothetical protein